MPKYHDEIIMGRMYENMYRPIQILNENHQLLLEKSPFGKFFSSPEPVMFMHQEPEIGLVHDADVKLYPAKNELEFKKALQRGDAVFVADPNGDRYLIKQKSAGEDIYQSPEERKFGYVDSAGKYRANYLNIWRFRPTGSSTPVRQPGSGEQYTPQTYKIDKATRPISSQKPQMGFDLDPKTGAPGQPFKGSNVFIDLFDIKGGTHAKGYIIPNKYFRAAKLPDTGNITPEQLATEIVQQYGGAIVSAINKNLNKFLERIKDNMSETAWTDEDIIDMVQDYRRFLGIQTRGKIAINDVLDDLTKFIAEKTEKGEIDKLAFSSDEIKRQFAREFVLNFNKKFSPDRFMNQVIDTGMDLF